MISGHCVNFQNLKHIDEKLDKRLQKIFNNYKNRICVIHPLVFQRYLSNVDTYFLKQIGMPV